MQRATEAGVSIVYIHYYGNRSDVIVSKPIEFAEKDKDYIYVIGTGFIDEETFPNTWGVSQTAPIVAGVIALMKELNPDLSPVEIKDILLKSGNRISSGYKILDACKAVNNTKKIND